VRIVPALLLALCLIGCNRASQDKDAVRQGVIDYLNGRKVNLEAMDVSVKSVQFNGKTAEAAVSIGLKGGSPEQTMSMTYKLEKQDSKWVVVGRQEAQPHGGMPTGGAMPGGAGDSGQGAMPAMPNPHGGAQMPAPDSLPPAGTKK
jgi:hypothetical protein